MSGPRVEASDLDPAAAPSELLEFNKALVGGLAGVGWTFPPASVEALRKGLSGNAEAYASPKASTIQVPGPHGDIPVRVIPADEPKGIYVHCHPGGWTIGSALAEDAQSERIAARTGLTVASIDYRLSPEHPYPVPLDECEAAARWILDHGAEALGARRFAIGGESAGANLALCSLLRINRDRPGAFAAVVLSYGNYCLTMTPSQRHASSGVMITRSSLQWFYDQYVPDRSLRDDPDVSPLFADLRGLPPVLISVGSADSLLDDSVFLACRMFASGVDCELQVIPGGEHSFDIAPLPITEAAVERIDDFLAARVAK
jgi:acetyl esterase/lipase